MKHESKHSVVALKRRNTERLFGIVETIHSRDERRASVVLQVRQPNAAAGNETRSVSLHAVLAATAELDNCVDIFPMRLWIDQVQRHAGTAAKATHQRACVVLKM